MLTRIAAGVLVHTSGFVLSNAVVVPGEAGVLVVDPGITTAEIECLASDLDAPVVAAFSTHPDWDHVLWHASLGDSPRWATARGAASIAAELGDPTFIDRVAAHLPEEMHGLVPFDGFGLTQPLAATEIPWDGPVARIIEHRAHAEGHAALLIEESRVLIAGDMLSDVFIPMLDTEHDNPIGNYLEALDLLEEAASGVDVAIPGHGTVARGDEVRARIQADRAYVIALRDGLDVTDPRVTSPRDGWEWAASMHEWQASALIRPD